MLRSPLSQGEAASAALEETAGTAVEPIAAQGARRRCAVCGATARPLLESHGVGFVHCHGCDHQQADLAVAPAHVQAVYGDDYFFGGGAGYPNYLAEGALLRRHGGRYGQVLNGQIFRSGTVLDVGAAGGFILKGLTDRGWSGVGIEPNETMARHARDVLGLDVRTGTLESMADEGERFDVVTMVQVAGHFHDLQRAFANAARLTRPDGYWLVETWDNQSRMARLLGRRWHQYNPPSVLQVFSRRSLARLCGSFGFEPVAFGRPRKYIAGSHVRSVLSYKAGEGAGGDLMRTMLRAVPSGMTFRYPSEDLFWGLFRRRAGAGS